MNPCMRQAISNQKRICSTRAWAAINLTGRMQCSLHEQLAAAETAAEYQAIYDAAFARHQHELEHCESPGEWRQIYGAFRDCQTPFEELVQHESVQPKRGP